jgi:CHAT domain-containing protein
MLDQNVDASSSKGFLTKRWLNTPGKSLDSAKRLKFYTGICVFLSILVCPLNGSSLAVPSSVLPVSAASPPQSLEDQSKRLYDAGQFVEAIPVLQELVQRDRLQRNDLGQAIALSNLSLVYQELGQWEEARKAITASLELVDVQQRSQLTEKPGASPSDRPYAPQRVLAQVLDVQARLQFASGQLEQALSTWERASTHYAQAQATAGVLRCRINQSQVLQAMGLYRQALKSLTELKQTLNAQPDSLVKLAGLRSLGDVIQATSDPGAARDVLNHSLKLARQLRSPDDISASLLSLGNVAYTQQETQTALAFYREAATTARSPTTRVKAQLNQLSLLLDAQQEAEIQTLLPQIQSQLDLLAPGRTKLYTHITFAQSLMKLANLRTTDGSELRITLSTSDLIGTSANEFAARLLMTTAQQAARLGDTQTESHALGTLGALYERSQQWTIAQNLTQKALLLAQASNAADITYRWQWQLGRLLKAQRKPEAAIAAYMEAVKTLRSLRQDLVATNPSVQFSFRESVEPIYRQLVELLLQPQAGSEASQTRLIQARNVIESLQVAELENFFREACLDVSFQIDTVVDQATQSAAVLYPIILPDRLEVILKLPKQALRHYTIPVSQTQVETVLEELRQDLTKPYGSRKVQIQSQQVYNWLIRPIEADLAASKTETLVFVLDGALRNVPMAALYDGQHYLIEKFSVALTPGLQLLNPRPLEQKKLQVLTAGLTEARNGLTALPNVKNEVSQIQSYAPGVVLLDQTFTAQQLQKEIGLLSFPIVHLATHGEFSSDPNKTFIAAWDQKIKVNQLDQLLRTREKSQIDAIELLVLSACETATGDKRAALGLAGVAIRAGARSTIASLWSLDDESSAVLMGQLYRELAQTKGNKANALRNAQLSLLQNPQYRQPRYWAPYVLIGNWL